MLAPSLATLLIVLLFLKSSVLICPFSGTGFCFVLPLGFQALFVGLEAIQLPRTAAPQIVAPLGRAHGCAASRQKSIWINGCRLWSSELSKGVSRSRQAKFLGFGTLTLRF